MNAPITIHLRGDDTDGHLALVEMVVVAGDLGPPLHVHPSHGEGFYVLEGEVTFAIGDEEKVGGPGTFVFAATDVPHTFANHTKTNARILVLCAPAGFESYFEEIAADFARGGWPSRARPDPTKAIAVGPGFRKPR
jgi:quercetin dioxygenase-like cupin family protein